MDSHVRLSAFLLIKPCPTFLRFRCICPQGYFGTLCDLDVNECEDSPCLHEGVCINKRGSFECICRPGYSGTFSLFLHPPPPPSDVEINTRVSESLSLLRWLDVTEATPMQN